jgi:hypothetical protein
VYVRWYAPPATIRLVQQLSLVAPQFVIPLPPGAQLGGCEPESPPPLVDPEPLLEPEPPLDPEPLLEPESAPLLDPASIPEPESTPPLDPDPEPLSEPEPLPDAPLDDDADVASCVPPSPLPLLPPFELPQFTEMAAAATTQRRLPPRMVSPPRACTTPLRRAFGSVFHLLGPRAPLRRY